MFPPPPVRVGVADGRAVVVGRVVLATVGDGDGDTDALGDADGDTDGDVVGRV